MNITEIISLSVVNYTLYQKVHKEVNRGIVSDEMAV